MGYQLLEVGIVQRLELCQLLAHLRAVLLAGGQLAPQSSSLTSRVASTLQFHIFCWQSGTSFMLAVWRDD